MRMTELCNFGNLKKKKGSQCELKIIKAYFRFIHFTISERVIVLCR